MFSLNGAVKYKYIPNYQDMRGGYDKLTGELSGDHQTMAIEAWLNDLL